MCLWTSFWQETMRRKEECKKCPARRQPDGAAKKHCQGFFTGIIPHPWSNCKEESMVKTKTLIRDEKAERGEIEEVAE